MLDPRIPRTLVVKFAAMGRASLGNSQNKSRRKLRKGVQRKCENGKVKKKQSDNHTAPSPVRVVFSRKRGGEGGPVRSALVGNVVDARLTVGRFSSHAAAFRQTHRRSSCSSHRLGGRPLCCRVGGCSDRNVKCTRPRDIARRCGRCLNLPCPLGSLATPTHGRQRPRSEQSRRVNTRTLKVSRHGGA